MSKLMTFVSFCLFAMSASSVEIKGGRLNSQKNIIEVDIAYLGGCTNHEFKVELQGCLESAPPQCFAEIKHNSNGERCKDLIQQTLEVTLDSLGINAADHDGASIQIRSGKSSTGSIELRFSGDDQVFGLESKVSPAVQ